MKFAERILDKYILEEVPRFQIDETVAEAENKLLAQAKEYKTLKYIYILDNEELVGVLSIKELLQADGRKLLKSFCDRPVVTVLKNTQLRQAVNKAMKSNIMAVPVVNRANELIGVIGEDMIIETLNSIHVRQLLHHSGFSVEVEGRMMDVVRAKVKDLFKARAPWILFGLAGGMLATLLVAGFEETLAEVVALAFFMPVVVYLGDAVGAQTQMLYVRALSIEHVSAFKFAKKELLVDFLLALMSGIIMGLFAWLMGFSEMIILIVSLAIFAVILKAGLVAILMPTFLYKKKKDPAVGSGPFTTILQDTLSLAIYFLVAVIVMNFY